MNADPLLAMVYCIYFGLDVVLMTDGLRSTAALIFLEKIPSDRQFSTEWRCTIFKYAINTTFISTRFLHGVKEVWRKFVSYRKWSGCLQKKKKFGFAATSEPSLFSQMTCIQLSNFDYIKIKHFVGLQKKKKQHHIV